MKLKYQVSEKFAIEHTVEDSKGAFQFLSECGTMFGVTECGNCGSSNLEHVYRTPQGYEYYSIKCKDCKHELKFGMQKEGGSLFPKGWTEPYQGGEAKKQSRKTVPDDSDDDLDDLD
jgi:hypothetical protein